MHSSPVTKIFSGVITYCGEKKEALYIAVYFVRKKPSSWTILAEQINILGVSASYLCIFCESVSLSAQSVFYIKPVIGGSCMNSFVCVHKC